MLEIIKRHEGHESQKEQIQGEPQISYNDWGHIVIRAINSDKKDALVVLDRRTSVRLIQFCKMIRLHPDEKDDLPF